MQDALANPKPQVNKIVSDEEAENSDLPKKSILVKPNKKPPPMKKIFLDT